MSPPQSVDPRGQAVAAVEAFVLRARRVRAHSLASDADALEALTKPTWNIVVDKRSEYLRQIAMTDTDFKRVYGYRPDAESGNKDIEEAWHLKRMPAWGWHNQSLRMLLHAGQVNAEAWRIHLERLWDHGGLTTPLPTEAA